MLADLWFYISFGLKIYRDDFVSAGYSMPLRFHVCFVRNYIGPNLIKFGNFLNLLDIKSIHSRQRAIAFIIVIILINAVLLCTDYVKRQTSL